MVAEISRASGGRRDGARRRAIIRRWAAAVGAALLFGGVWCEQAAAEVVQEPILIHPDDGFSYVPLDAAFIDSDNLLLVYARGTRNPDFTFDGEGTFFRRYRTSTGTFSGAVRLDGTLPNDNFIVPAAVDGANGVGRVAFLIEGDTVLEGGVTERNIFLAGVDADGGTTPTAIRVNQEDAFVGSVDLAVRSDGSTLVVWWELQLAAPGEDSRRFMIFGRLYDEDLDPIDDPFTIYDDAPASFPRVDAEENFAIAFRAGALLPEQTVLVSLDADGDERWLRLFDGAARTVTVLDNDTVIVGFHEETGGAEDDAFLRIYDEGGAVIEGGYNVSLPRSRDQRNVAVAAHRGLFTGAVWTSTAADGMLDFINVDGIGTPVSADEAIIDNFELGSPEVVPEQRVHVAGGPGDTIGVLYNGEEDDVLAIGARAKLVLLRSGTPQCPENVSCGDLIPFRTSGAANRRFNLVVRPTGYALGAPFIERRKFYREFRDVVATNILYGSRQHRAHTDKLNILVQLRDAGLPDEENPFRCETPFVDSDDEFEFEETYPWVHTVGAQQNRDVYGTIGWCATDAVLANGGGTFYYPGTEFQNTFEHEFAHVAYNLGDEYVGGSYIEPDPPGPLAHQHASEAACRDDAIAEGWDPDDCHLACNVSMDSSCVIDWWSNEVRHPPGEFATFVECEDFIAEHDLDDVGGCFNASGGGFDIPGLIDVMQRGASGGDPIVRTGDDFRRPEQAFQRACERRVLFTLTDPAFSP